MNNNDNNDNNNNNNDNRVLPWCLNDSEIVAACFAAASKLHSSCAGSVMARISCICQREREKDHSCTHGSFPMGSFLIELVSNWAQF